MESTTSTQHRNDAPIPLSNSGPLVVLPHNVMTIIPNKFYWATLDIPAISNSQAHYFCVDEVFKYDAFNKDFGPLDLGCVYKYCRLVLQKLRDEYKAGRYIVHYSSSASSFRTNSAFLVGAFQVIVLMRSVADVCRSLENLSPALLDYRDASSKISRYYISVGDCLSGLEYAVRLGWFNFNKFDVDEYMYYSQIENGDINWIIPGKIVAFSTPVPERIGNFNGLTPYDYVSIFKHLKITAVVRLNECTSYDKALFVNGGLKHYDLYFPDGTAPSKRIMAKFWKIVEENKQVAVHCLAGLGRTGTLIGSYAIRNYRFPYLAWIGWNRIVRPGSILGAQHYFLKTLQATILKYGYDYDFISESEEADEEETQGEMEEKNCELGEILQGQGEALKAKRLLNAMKDLKIDVPKDGTINWNYGNALLSS